MGVLTRFREGVASGYKGFKFPSSANGMYGSMTGVLGGYLNLLAGSSYNYRTEAGRVYDNNPLFSAVQFVARAFNEAPICIQQKNKDGKWEICDGPKARAFCSAWNRPNEYYPGKKLTYGLLLSYLSRGNGFAYKVPDRLGRTKGFIYIPHWQIAPYVEPGSSDYLTGYIYQVNGERIVYKPEEILHLRYGLHPENTRLGIEPAYAAMREICTDNQISTFEAAIIRNGGVPSIHIKPPVMKDEDGDQILITPDTAQKYKTKYREEFTGENAGGVLVSTTPMEIDKIGFSPKELTLQEMRPQNVERILSSIGLDPMVLGYESTSRTYSNMREAFRAAHDNCIIPLWMSIAEDLTYYVLPDFIQDDDYRVAFDQTNIAALQEDVDQLFKRATDGYFKGVLKRSDARRIIGEPYDKEDDVYFSDVQAINSYNAEEHLQSEQQNDKKKDEIGAIVKRWRRE